MRVEVVSNIIPNPAAKVVFAVAPVIVTLEFPKVPLVNTNWPLLSEVWLAANALILTKVPVPLFTSGLALGKLVSFAIGTKPPTSSTKSIILASIAAVVATLLSAADHVSPDCISSALAKL